MSMAISPAVFVRASLDASRGDCGNEHLDDENDNARQPKCLAA